MQYLERHLRIESLRNCFPLFFYVVKVLIVFWNGPKDFIKHDKRDEFKNVDMKNVTSLRTWYDTNNDFDLKTGHNEMKEKYLLTHIY